MRLVVQRVKSASVLADGELTGSIGEGLLVFIGIHKEDVPEDTCWLVNKLVYLRIFSDDQGKMNRNLKDVNGAILLISQFTLYGNCLSGRRPDFFEAASGEQAKHLYNKFIEEVKSEKVEIQTGRFGAHMEITSVNNGPITLILENGKK